MWAIPVGLAEMVEDVMELDGACIGGSFQGAKYWIGLSLWSPGHSNLSYLRSAVLALTLGSL